MPSESAYSKHVRDADSRSAKCVETSSLTRIGSNLRAQCDGATPCTRCKSDDAICAYGKHKKTDKIVFRKGFATSVRCAPAMHCADIMIDSYVQMLERQHAQLIAGVQELYRCTQNGQGWTQPPLDLVNHGQPLTHKILEGLGVLRTEEWADGEGQDGMSSWVSFEQQAQEGSGIMYDASQSPSPAATPTHSPISATQSAFPNSTTMANRLSDFDISTSQFSGTPSMTAPQLFSCPTFPHVLESNLPKAGHYNPDLRLHISPLMPMYNSHNDSYSHPDTINASMGDQNLPFGSIDWMSVTDDMFDQPINQGLPLQVQ